MNSFVKIALTLLSAVWSDFFTPLSTVWSAILSELPNDEVSILVGAYKDMATKANAGATIEEILTEGLNYVAAQEGFEMSKIGTQIMQAFATKLAPPA